MEKLFLLLLLCLGSSAVKHSLKYVLTASSGVTNLPPVVSVALIDDIQPGYCDKESLQPRDWVKNYLDTDPQQLAWYSEKCHEILPNVFKARISNVKQRLNQSDELPSVSLLQKTPSSPVSCHATGFYPHRAVMFWRKDGEDLHEDVDQGEILPNHDGTFQMRVDLDISSVTPEDWRRYDCVFHLSGVKEDVVTKLDKAEIRTNEEKPSNVSVSIITAVVVLTLVLIAVTGFMVYKKKKAKHAPLSPDSDSELSEKLNEGT
ncbi:class I histocompatibility antigen, F10 alpha chain-like isoform X2 [Seriola aureovittata]|uniref:class I histocompatibility antigen, F10 alpha chain-like isoform X2 n=1 Tax=Seriola aureovittata TaxID=2871759 RepID=UPI0024BD9247|nr:class I histocompatibility antigen, F10 alpha chain-like isoform X2 [Seriola aureovittata]